MTVVKQRSPTVQPIDHRPFHYYDMNPTPEDLMGESTIQGVLVAYLRQVLAWLYRNERWFIASNLNIYQYKTKHAVPLAPDLALFKGVIITQPALRSLRSWKLYEPNRLPPNVVFEISSDETWQNDVNLKPFQFGALGVREYYAYDPNEPPYWPQSMGRLRGWKNMAGNMHELPKDSRGRIWSDELASWLTPEGDYLRLYDIQNHLRLTEAEAERAAKEAERAAKEAERTAKEAERAAKEIAWAKLRELGVDPETLTSN